MLDSIENNGERFVNIKDPLKPDMAILGNCFDVLSRQIRPIRPDKTKRPLYSFLTTLSATNSTHTYDQEGGGATTKSGFLAADKDFW